MIFKHCEARSLLHLLDTCKSLYVYKRDKSIWSRFYDQHLFKGLIELFYPIFTPDRYSKHTLDKGIEVYRVSSESLYSDQNLENSNNLYKRDIILRISEVDCSWRCDPICVCCEDKLSHKDITIYGRGPGTFYMNYDDWFVRVITGYVRDDIYMSNNDLNVSIDYIYSVDKYYVEWFAVSKDAEVHRKYPGRLEKGYEMTRILSNECCHWKCYCDILITHAKEFHSYDMAPSKDQSTIMNNSSDTQPIE